MKNKRLLFSVICFLALSFIIVCMTFTHQRTIVYQDEGTDIVGTLSINDARGIYEGDDRGKNFEADNKMTSKYVTLVLGEDYDVVAEIVLVVDFPNDTEGKMYYVPQAAMGDRYVWFELDSDDYTDFVIVSDYEWNELQFHEEAPAVSYKRVKIHWLLTIGSLIIAFLVSFGVYKLQRGWNGIDVVVAFFKKRKKALIKIGITVLVIAIVSIIFEKILGLIKGQYFNIERGIFIAGILMVVAIFIGGRKLIKDKPEVITSGLIVVIGSMMILVSTTAHVSWDTDSHYLWAYADSYMGMAYMTQVDYGIMCADYFGQTDRESYDATLTRMNGEYGYVFGEFRDISVPHVFAGAGIAIARFFALPFIWIYRAGEFAQVLVYALLAYLGMRKLKSGKILYAIIALFPTNMFLAANYSYDYLVIGCSMLGMAYFIGNCQKKDGYISTKDTVIMVLSFFMACLPKQIYFPLLIIPFLMPSKKIENKKKYYAICASGLFLMMASLFIRSLGTTSGTGDSRGGEGVNPGEQIAYILGNPLEYTNTLIEFLKKYLSITNADEYLVFFAYLGFATWQRDVLFIIMIIAAFTDKSHYDDYKNAVLIRGYSILMFIGTTVLIATSMYVAFTPVGANVINGCQGRYLTPLIFPLLVTLGSSKINNAMNKTIYNGLLLGISSVCLFSTIYDLIIVTII